MILLRNKTLLKLIPVFICLHFSLNAQDVILNDLVKGNWFVEGDLKDSLVKLSFKRNKAFPHRQYAFTKSGILNRCDSVYQSSFDEKGNEVHLNKLDCNSPASFKLKHQILFISTGQASYYFAVDPRKGGGYTLRKTKAEYYNAN